MNFNNRNFSDLFPEGCPPSGAENCEIQVYRLVKGNSLNIDDFKSYVELGLNYTPNKKYPFQEYGISVNTSLEEVKKYLKANPYLRKRFKSIAYGNTYLCTGVVMATPSRPQPSHHSWWLYKEAIPDKYFKIVGGEMCEGDE